MANEKRLIDANEVKKKIWYGNSDPSNLRQYASGFIDNAPTVDAVEVVHGKWEAYCGGLLKCTACGYEYTDYLECQNYCPNCGAKMDGGNEDG